MERRDTDMCEGGESGVGERGTAQNKSVYTEITRALIKHRGKLKVTFLDLYLKIMLP